MKFLKRIIQAIKDWHIDYAQEAEDAKQQLKETRESLAETKRKYSHN